MKKILHNTTKYDGSLHYRFDVTEILRTDRALVVYKDPDALIKSYRGEFRGNKRNLGIFFPDSYYNVIIMWEKDWSPRCIYVNIATPAVWNDGEVTAIDMDLDLFRRHGEDEIHIDDEDEFELHQVKYRYPQELIDRCLAETDLVYGLMQKGESMFSDEVYDWRPGKQLPFDLPAG
ncbi:MAG: DUF402 domain-containing protein [Spirochaetales bacterium]|nr:DUF402 domain-containing protein [Spirochaetales bacterium]